MQRYNAALIITVQVLLYSGNQLKITSVRKEDRGIYYCFAENGVGRGQKRDVNVEVKFAPVITAPQPRVGQALKYDMNLECHIEAYPPPVITWHKNNIQLSNNEHYSISNFATADQYTETTLRIITIEQHQYGEYVCKAQNKLGLAETKVQLYGKRIIHIFSSAHPEIRMFFKFLAGISRETKLIDYPQEI